MRAGGTVVYSTCTLDEEQNDAVVVRACSDVAAQYGIRMVACDMRNTLAKELALGVVGEFKLLASTQSNFCLQKQRRALLA